MAKIRPSEGNSVYYENPIERLFQRALLEDNFREAINLLRNNPESVFPHISIQEQATLLGWAVQHGSLNDVQFLLREENREALFTAVQNCDMQRNTILHKASFRTGDSETTIQIIRLLLNAGAQINSVNANNQTPLTAIIEYQLTPAEELEEGDIADYEGIEIALYFLINHSENVIPTLNPREASQSLIWVLSEDDGDLNRRILIADRLIARGADVNMLDIEQEPLITKILDDRPYEACWLLKQANIDLTPLNLDQAKELAFDLCFAWDRDLGNSLQAQRALERLIAHGLDPQVIDQGQNLLVRAITCNSREVFFAILNSPMVNIDPSATDDDGKTALNYAIERGNIEFFQTLINSGARFNIEEAASDIFEKVLETYDSNYLEIYKSLYFILQGEDKATFNRVILNKIRDFQNHLNQGEQIHQITQEKLQFFFRSLTPNLTEQQLNNGYRFFGVQNIFDLILSFNAARASINEQEFNVLITPRNEEELDLLIEQIRGINQIANQQANEAREQELQAIIRI
ncbi:MAG: hypothetical protein COT84_00625 [Chlamydiae bacterium CG10_big_fil_rev_8_21_14_0_10_35_9]|nr:MAG: hypothetical protein COT84_00625 [Chlamydiae bacterium CG10_big_fil_rev_8_21_14_0_10_35_9]